jgi:hypothetical protein
MGAIVVYIDKPHRPKITFYLKTNYVRRLDWDLGPAIGGEICANKCERTSDLASEAMAGWIE